MDLVGQQKVAQLVLATGLRLGSSLRTEGFLVEKVQSEANLYHQAGLVKSLKLKMTAGTDDN